jgi:hypothetical protein
MCDILPLVCAEWFHMVPATVLILPALFSITGIADGSTVANVLMVGGFGLLGGLPPQANPTGWLSFGANLSVATGVLYAKCALTNDACLAKSLCYPRMTIGVLNVIALLNGSQSLPFIIYPLFEIGSAVWIHLTV